MSNEVPYRTKNQKIWGAMTDAERRAILDQFIMTADIPSNVDWEHLDHGTRSAILFTKTVPGID